MFRILLFVFVLTAPFLPAAPQPQPFRRPLVFEPNRGQAPPQVKWLARGPEYQLFLTDKGVTMMIQEGIASPSAKDGVPGSLRLPNLEGAPAKLRYSTVQMKLAGSRPWRNVTGMEPTGGISNYLYRTDGKAPLTNVPHYARITVAGVYDGVDLVFYSREGELEYDFIVAPGADPGQIRLEFEGAERMRVDHKSGDLVLVTSGGSEVRQVRPKAYQQVEGKRVEVASGYELAGNGRAAFTVARYDRRLPLVIDPIIRFVKGFGGSGSEHAYAIAVDSEGNSYVTGGTGSRDFPVTNSSEWLNCRRPFLGFCSTSSNIFVTKISPTGSILFSTYAGVGSGRGIAVDSTGVYVTGDDFPADGTNPVGWGGGTDLFILKLSPTGAAIYRNHVRGSADDFGTAVALDSQQNAWVTGWTYSRNLTGRPAHQQSIADIIVAKFSPTGQMLFVKPYSNSGETMAHGIAVDSADQPWVTGKACMVILPNIEGGPVRVVNCSVLVVQLSKEGNVRMSTVFGGSDAGDAGTAIVPNGSNSAYVTGYTNSATFPTTTGAYQTAKASTGPHAFVTEVDSSTVAGRIVRSTLLGGDGDTFGYAITSVDAEGVYIAGSTTSAHFPGVTGVATNARVGFISKLSHSLTQLHHTKLIGTTVHGVATLVPAAPPRIPQIFAAGSSGIPGVSIVDAFVVKMDDDAAQSQLLWHNPTTGQLSAWVLDAQGRVASTRTVQAPCAGSSQCSQSWKVIGTLDSNRDGTGDILLHDANTGELQVWLLNSGGAVAGIQSLSRRCGRSDGCSLDWKPVGVGDFSHDGHPDILWHSDATGQLQAWVLSDSGQVTNTRTLSKVCRLSDGCWPKWRIIAIGDFDGDRIDDLFWYDTSTGRIDVAMLNNAGSYKTTQWLAKVCGPSDGCSQTWKPAGFADINQDGIGDLLWKNTITGELSAWLLNGTGRVPSTQSLSLRCDASSGCPQNSLPAGVLRNLQATP